LKNYLNSATISTQLNQLFRGLSGVITLILIPLFLTSKQQGYWFTMSSLAALAMLAELGFFQITLQFAAHEFAYLEFDNGRIVGSEEHQKRLAGLLVFCIKWTMFVAVIAFPIMWLIGFLFLSQSKSGVLWGVPWATCVVGGAITFFTGALLSFLEGCNLVAAIQRLRLLIIIATLAVTWACLFLGFGLHALSLSMVSGGVAGVYLLWRKHGHLFRGMAHLSHDAKYSWGPQVLSLLWRYALSWGAGYFIFQIYSPLTFQFKGPAEAGRVGLSVTLWMGVFAVSNSWIYAATPRLNMLVSKKDWSALDSLFRRNLVFSSGTFLLGTATILLSFWLLRGHLPAADRFLDRFTDLLPMAFLAVIWFLQLIVNGLATYLRAHKKEPLVLPSLLSAVYVTATTIMCAKYLPQTYFFLGWLSSSVWGLPWIVHIFKKSRREWRTS
jgi:hypothetical protein